MRTTAPWRSRGSWKLRQEHVCLCGCLVGMYVLIKEGNSFGFEGCVCVCVMKENLKDRVDGKELGPGGSVVIGDIRKRL